MLRRQLLVLVVTFCIVGCATFTFGQTSTKTKTTKPASFRQLSRADLMRAIQVTKGFTGEAPRAVATLAIARSILERRELSAAASN